MSCIIDTASINLTNTAGQLSADVVVDPAAGIAPNLLVINPAGVYVGSDGWVPLPATLAFSSADGPTFVATTSADLRAFLGPGDKMRLVQSGVPGYFFVTAIAAGTITLYGGTDYVLAASAITLPYFSKVKSPIGFPFSPVKWTEVLSDTSDRTQVSPVGGTWYNPGSLSLAIPIGIWRTLWSASLEVHRASTNAVAKASLSTSNSAESDSELTAFIQSAGAGISDNQIVVTVGREKTLTLAVKTSYFLIVDAIATSTDISLFGSTGSPSIVRAQCAYL